MSKRCFSLLIAIAIVAACAPSAYSAPNSPAWAALEVAPFDVPPGVDLPADFQRALADALLKQLSNTHRFGQVWLSAEKPAEANPASLRLTGSITEFRKGSRAERYWVGYGAGKAVLKAHIRFIDVSSGSVKLEKDVDGKVIMGRFGGDAKGATRGLAKEIAKDARRIP